MPGGIHILRPRLVYQRMPWHSWCGLNWYLRSLYEDERAFDQKNKISPSLFQANSWTVRRTTTSLSFGMRSHVNVHTMDFCPFFEQLILPESVLTCLLCCQIFQEPSRSVMFMMGCTSILALRCTLPWSLMLNRSNATKTDRKLVRLPLETFATVIFIGQQGVAIRCSHRVSFILRLDHSLQESDVPVFITNVGFSCSSWFFVLLLPLPFLCLFFPLMYVLSTGYF